MITITRSFVKIFGVASSAGLGVGRGRPAAPLARAACAAPYTLLEEKTVAQTITISIAELGKEIGRQIDQHLAQCGVPEECLATEDCERLGQHLLSGLLDKYTMFAPQSDEKPQATIPLEVYSDDRVATAHCDALSWFEQAEDEVIASALTDTVLRDIDHIARFMEKHDLNVARVFAYISFDPQNYGNSVGYSCDLDTAAAMAWLKKHRPHLAKQITEED